MKIGKNLEITGSFWSWTLMIFQILMILLMWFNMGLQIWGNLSSSVPEGHKSWWIAILVISVGIWATYMWIKYSWSFKFGKNEQYTRDI